MNFVYLNFLDQVALLRTYMLDCDKTARAFKNQKVLSSNYFCVSGAHLVSKKTSAEKRFLLVIPVAQ